MHIRIKLLLRFNQIGQFSIEAGLNFELCEEFGVKVDFELVGEVFLEGDQEDLLLLLIGEDQLHLHLRPLDRDHLRQHLHKVQSLLLRRLVGVDLALGLIHCLDDGGDGELRLIFRTDALLHDDVGDVLLQALLLLVPLQVAHL